MTNVLSQRTLDLEWREAGMQLAHVVRTESGDVKAIFENMEIASACIAVAYAKATAKLQVRIVPFWQRYNALAANCETTLMDICTITWLALQTSARRLQTFDPRKGNAKPLERVVDKLVGKDGMFGRLAIKVDGLLSEAKRVRDSSWDLLKSGHQELADYQEKVQESEERHREEEIIAAGLEEEVAELTEYKGSVEKSLKRAEKQQDKQMDREYKMHVCRAFVSLAQTAIQAGAQAASGKDVSAAPAQQPQDSGEGGRAAAQQPQDSGAGARTVGQDSAACRQELAKLRAELEMKKQEKADLEKKHPAASDEDRQGAIDKVCQEIRTLEQKVSEKQMEYNDSKPDPLSALRQAGEAAGSRADALQSRIERLDETLLKVAIATAKARKELAQSLKKLENLTGTTETHKLTVLSLNTCCESLRQVCSALEAVAKWFENVSNLVSMQVTRGEEAKLYIEDEDLEGAYSMLMSVMIHCVGLFVDVHKAYTGMQWCAKRALGHLRAPGAVDVDETINQLTISC